MVATETTSLTTDGSRRDFSGVRAGLRIGARDYLHLKPLVEDIQSFLGEAAGDLIDFGCGQKPYREFCSDAVTSYVGVDHDPANTEADVISSGEHTPVESASADVAICLQVLEHVPEPLTVLREIHRVLRPGGNLFVTVPQSWEMHEMPHDYYRYTSYGMSYLVQAAGFQVERITIHGSDWSTLGLKFNRRFSRLRILNRIGLVVYPIVNFICGRLEHMQGLDVMNFSIRCHKVESEDNVAV